MTVAPDPPTRNRPKTLEESKGHLLQRLKERRSPMTFCDPAVAERALRDLGGLDGETWGTAWAAAAAPFEQAARDAEERGDHRRAADAWFQAYAFYFIGRYPSPNHPRKQANAVKARECYLRAARWFDPPLERVAIPFEGRSGEGREVVVYLRKPAGVQRPPVVALWGGIDSYKEERHDRTEALLEAGLATVALDMPGTGESPVLGSVDAERQYTPVFEWIRSRPDLDGARIGCIGMSFGGYWATKLAHTHRDYLAAAVSWGGGAHYNFQPDWVAQSRYAGSYLMDLAETRAGMMGLSSFDDYAAQIGTFSLLDQGVLDRPSSPLLLVNGKNDQQVPIRDLYLVLEHGDPKAARVFPGGHMGQTPQTLPTIVAWLQERLGAAR